MSEPSAPPPPRRRPWPRIALAVLVSGGVLALLAGQLDWEGAVEALRAARPGWIGIALLWSCVIVWLRGVRWTALQPGPGLAINTAAISVQTFFNRIAPMRLGELTLPHLLRRYAGLDATRTFLILVVVRIVELAVLIGLCAVATLVRTGTTHVAWLLGLGAVLLGVIAILAYFRAAMRLATRVLGAVARRTGADRFAVLPRALAAVERAVAGEAQLSTRQRASLLGWTLTIQLVQIASLDAFLRAFGVGVDPLAAVQAVSVAMIGPALPLPSVGMVGTLEASWIAGYAWIGVRGDVVILSGIAAQLVTLAFAAVVALPSWWQLRRRVRAAAD